METTLLNHYKLPSLNPSEWPVDKDFDDSSDDESLPGLQKRKSKSRYSALNRNAGLRSSVPGAERTKEGVENLVQKDEADPLGGPQSVIQLLRLRGLPVGDDGKLSMDITLICRFYLMTEQGTDFYFLRLLSRQPFSSHRSTMMPRRIPCSKDSLPITINRKEVSFSESAG